MNEASIDPRPEMKDHSTCEVNIQGRCYYECVVAPVLLCGVIFR